MESVKIFENALEEKDFEKIKNTLTSNNFPWYFNNFKVDEIEKHIPDTKNFQFTHIFYHDYNISSNFFEILYPIFNKLNVASLIKVKANLTTRWESVEFFYPHKDNNFENAKTAIYYVNSNNGLTNFIEENIFIDSVENKLVSFPSGILHSGSTHTNSKARIVININYFEEN